MHLSLNFWPLFLTREIALERRIPASKAAVLRIVQDPEEALRISPLIYSVVRDPPDKTQPEPDMAWYTLQERVPLTANSASSNTLRVLWGRMEDGADAQVFAAIGTHLNSEVRVREVEKEDMQGDGQEEAVYSEKLVIQGLFFLMPFIVSTARKTHITMLDIVADKVLQRGI